MTASHIEYQRYTAFRKKVLDAVGEHLFLLPENAISNDFNFKSFSDRSGAKAFESFIVELMKANENDLVSIIEEAAKGSGFRFEGFQYVDDTGIAGARHWFDLGLLYSDANLIGSFKAPSVMPINIKATEGTSADNTCGWRGLAAALFGAETEINKKTDLVNRLKGDGLNNTEVCDYSFWVFVKGQDRPFTSQKSYSLLEHNPNIYSFNSSQPFPVQIKASSIPGVEDGELSFLERQTRFLTWLFDNLTKKAKKDLEASTHISTLLVGWSSAARPLDGEV